MVAKQLYDVRASQQETSEHSALDGFTFARKVTEGDNFYQENPTQNYSKTMRKYRIAIEAVITWHMRTYDRLLSLMPVMA